MNKIKILVLTSLIFLMVSSDMNSQVIVEHGGRNKETIDLNEQDDVQSTSVPGQLAPRLQNLGNHTFPVTNNSARAQLFINQGLMLAYGFNHAEAERSFREAARLDPNCAMAYWGMALVLGPNINMSMSPEAERPAHETIRKAVTLKKTASAREQAYIDALAKRYMELERSLSCFFQ